MKITRKQLKKLISEAMFDYRTLKKDRIPPEMITDPEFKQHISDISSTGSEYFSQASELGDTLGAFPRAIDIAGGYESAANLGLRKLLRHDYGMSKEGIKYILNKYDLQPQGIKMKVFSIFSDIGRVMDYRVALMGENPSPFNPPITMEEFAVDFAEEIGSYAGIWNLDESLYDEILKYIYGELVKIMGSEEFKEMIDAHPWKDTTV